MAYTLLAPYVVTTIKSDLIQVDYSAVGGQSSPESWFNVTGLIYAGLFNGDFLPAVAYEQLLIATGSYINYSPVYANRAWSLDVELGHQHSVPAALDADGHLLPGPAGSVFMPIFGEYWVQDPPTHAIIPITIPATPHYWSDEGVVFSRGSAIGTLLFGTGVLVNELGEQQYTHLQWQHSDDGGQTWDDIAGATATTYILAPSDVGDVLRLEADFIDEAGSTQVAFSAVSPTVVDVNRAPHAQEHAHAVYYGHSDTLSAATLLTGATDPDGDSLSVIAVGNARHGTVSLDSQGNAVFVPAIGYTGANGGFDYTISDGNGGTSTARVSVGVDTRFGGPPAYIWNGNHTGSELVDFTGDSARHQFVAGSGATTIHTGSGGSALALGGGASFVYGGSGKDAIKFGAGLATVVGGAGGNNTFQFVKGQIHDAGPGGQVDTIVDFHDAPTGWSPTHDMIYLSGFTRAATITYVRDLGSSSRHLYAINDGSYHAEFELDYAGPGHNLAAGQWGFL